MGAAVAGIAVRLTRRVAPSVDRSSINQTGIASHHRAQKQMPLDHRLYSIVAGFAWLVSAPLISVLNGSETNAKLADNTQTNEEAPMAPWLFLCALAKRVGLDLSVAWLLYLPVRRNCCYFRR